MNSCRGNPRGDIPHRSQAIAWRLSLCACMVLATGRWASAQGVSETEALKNALKMEPMGLDSDLKKIEKQWAAIEQHVRDAEQIKIRSGKVSNWSVGQQVMHIAMVIDGLGQQIPRLLADPTIGADEPALALRGQILTAGSIPRGVGKASSSVAVRFQPTLEQVREEMKRAKASWSQVARRSKDIAASPAKYPHFALGPMTSADWVRFIAIHTAHHLKIVDDILADAAARQD